VTGRTIVYLPNWLGDMVMATPFLQSLRAHLKDELWAIGKIRHYSFITVITSLTVLFHTTIRD
jgi:ADP-heptose:LPS heptosyltransferase